MKRSILSIAITFAICLTSASMRAAETDQEVEARKAALDLAGAFSNDGFKIRDGHWSGTVKPNDHILIAVNLYSGNQYWFSVGAPDTATKLTISVYDETGKQVSTENYENANKVAAGFLPTSSGQYYVWVGLVDGTESSVCLVYSYK